MSRSVTRRCFCLLTPSASGRRALVVLALVLLLPTVTGACRRPARPRATPVAAPAPPPGTSARDHHTADLERPDAAPGSVGGCPLFPSDSFWHADVSELPVHPSSGQWVASIGLNASLKADFGS